jgi:hypothetical protein
MRAAELNNLRLAMAMFAVQLDMFEMRLREGPLKNLRKESGMDSVPSDIVGKPRTGNDRP